MNHSRISKAFQAFAEGFALLAEALVEEEPKDFQAPEAEEVPWEEEPKKVTKTSVSKKVWEEEPPAKKDSEVIDLKDLQDLGRRVIKLHGAPALAKVLKEYGLKNLSSADPKDYLTLYTELKELADD